MSNWENMDWESTVKNFFSGNKTKPGDKKVEFNYNKTSSPSGAMYCIGWFGALVYYMQTAVGFGAVVTGFLKAFIWPATIVYKLLEMFYGIAG